MVRYRTCKYILHSQLKLLILPSKAPYSIRGYKNIAFGSSGPDEHIQSIETNDDERHGAPGHTYFHTLLSQNKSYIDPELANMEFYKLLQLQNITGFITLFHLLLSRYPHFRLPNQTWSTFMSLVCTLAHYSGACMVYHELIDNHTYYSSEKYAIDKFNPHVPFLVNCDTLEALASIYVQNKDVDRIQGLLQYFKRFYSYYSHNHTYKTLRICIVEASAQVNHLAQTLKLFRDLAFAFRGHRNIKSSRKQKEISAITSFAQFRARRDAIRENISHDISFPEEFKTEFENDEDAICQELNIVPFTASEERNIHSFTERNSLIDGKIVVTDMPFLYELMRTQVSTVFLSGGLDRISALITLIRASHFRLNAFVIAALCELGKTSEAVLLIQQLLQDYPRTMPQVLVDLQTFLLIMRSCWLKSMQDITPREDKDLQLKLSEAMLCYRQVMSTHTVFKPQEDIIAHFLSAMLNCNSVTKDQLLYHLELLARDDTSGLQIRLNSDTYKKFRSIFHSEYPWIVE